MNYQIVADTRKQRGFTQAQLADKTGIRQDIISRIENGKELNPTLKTVEKLSQALRIPINKLSV